MQEIESEADVGGLTARISCLRFASKAAQSEPKLAFSAPYSTTEQVSFTQG